MRIGRPRQCALEFASALVTLLLLGDAGAQEPADVPTPTPVSYYRQVRPVLQRNCTGCHQPAKPGGKLVLTSYEALQTGGENGPGFVAGDGDLSNLVTYISGEMPEMPRNAAPLPAPQIALIARWITEGAVDDTPASARDEIDPDHPPVYHTAPVVSALRYSPDSTLLAVSGFHEVLLHSADGPSADGLPLARLIGRSGRITALEFSPDGATLAAVGGTPALFGEVQLWDVPTRTLRASATFGPDTLYGAAYTTDGTLLAVGGADNRARILNTADLSQHVKFDAHSDYVQGVTFSGKNDHMITVSRDMSMKLAVVENGQFVDNITSITPGALKGGLVAVQLRPGHEEVLAGGADGEPKLYRIFRTQDRKIGDDFNKVRAYPALDGRIFDLRFNADGSKFVAGASTALGGAARVYSTEDGKLLFDLKQADGSPLPAPVYAVAFRPDGTQVAVAGFDGLVRLYDVASGGLVREFVPVPIASE